MYRNHVLLSYRLSHTRWNNIIICVRLLHNNTISTSSYTAIIKHQLWVGVEHYFQRRWSVMLFNLHPHSTYRHCIFFGNEIPQSIHAGWFMLFRTIRDIIRNEDLWVSTLHSFNRTMLNIKHTSKISVCFNINNGGRDFRMFGYCWKTSNGIISSTLYGVSAIISYDTFYILQLDACAIIAPAHPKAMKI